MAGKKYYAVKKGKTTGIFKSWAECRDSVDGYSGAEYKGFMLLEEAEAYMKGTKGLVEDSAAQKAGRIERHASKASESKSKDSHAASKAGGADREDGYAASKAGGADRKDGYAASKAGGADRKDGDAASKAKGADSQACAGECPEPGTLLAYVDGSYDDSLKKYAFGCVFITSDGQVETEYGNGDNEQSLRHRNVTGEMLGAMYAVKTAILSGFRRVEICYDYQGIEKWVTGEWNSRTELTRKYAIAMREWGKDIEICFTKVAAHTNVYYNELADKMAKTGLREGNGIPKVRILTSDEIFRNDHGAFRS